MIIKIVGALLIICGCGSVGLLHILSLKREEAALRQLIGALDFMGCELQYRLTPLPQLCRLCAAEAREPISDVLLQLAIELEQNSIPTVSGCTAAVLRKSGKLPPVTQKMMLHLGACLGRFDAVGQLRGIENTRTMCRQALEELTENKSARHREYQTLAICVGAALAILFM